jgi:hypothetical protein
MALSTATEQVMDTRSSIASSVFLSGWHNPNFARNSSDGDLIITAKAVVDRPWTKVTFWALGGNSPADFSFDVTLDYIPTIDDTDDWDQVLTNSGLITVTPSGTKNVDLAEFTVSGLVPGTLCYLEYTLNNFTQATNRSIRVGNFHFHTAADA